MIELVDGSFIAQMGLTDMRLPIQYALTYPDRLLLELPRLDLAKLQKLEFFSPDREQFPAIDLAYRALRLGGIAPVVLNAANEVAVAAFLEGKIGFGDITRTIGKLMDRCEREGAPSIESIEQVLKADKEARCEAEEFISVVNRGDRKELSKTTL